MGGAWGSSHVLALWYKQLVRVHLRVAPTRGILEDTVSAVSELYLEEWVVMEAHL